MNHQETKQLEMLSRVCDWGLRYRHIFKPQSLGRQTLENIAAEIAELKRLSATQIAGMGTARRGTRTRAKTRGALFKLLKAINRTARSINRKSLSVYGFPLSKVGRDYLLLRAARVFVRFAAPVAAEFIPYEMDVIRELEEAIANFEQAIHDQATAKRSHIVATLAIHAKLANALLDVKRLDVILRNKVPDPVIIRAWERASHVEKLRRRSKGKPLANTS